MIKKHVGTDALAADSYGDIYISDIFGNGLYRYTPQNDQLNLVTVFPDIDMCVKSLHNDAICLNEYICFLCYNRPLMHVYSCLDCRIRAIKLKEDRGDCLRLFSDQECIYILANSGRIWEYHINDDSVTVCSKGYANEFKKLIKSLKGEINSVRFHSGFLVCENDGNHFIKVDILNEKTQMFTSPCDDLRTVYFFDNRYWFLKNHSFDVIVWNDRNGEIKEFKSADNRWINSNHSIPYIEMGYCNQCIYIVNYYAGMTVKADEETLSLIPAFEQRQGYVLANGNPYGGVFNRLIEDKDYVYFFPCRSRDIIKMRKKDGEIKHVLSYVNISEDYLNQMDIIFEGDIVIDEDAVEGDWPLLCLVKNEGIQGAKTLL